MTRLLYSVTDVNGLSVTFNNFDVGFNAEIEASFSLQTFGSVSYSVMSSIGSTFSTRSSVFSLFTQAPMLAADLDLLSVQLALQYSG